MVILFIMTNIPYTFSDNLAKELYDCFHKRTSGKLTEIEDKKCRTLIVSTLDICAIKRINGTISVIENQKCKLLLANAWDEERKKCN